MTPCNISLDLSSLSCQCVKAFNLNAKKSLIAYLFHLSKHKSACYYRELEATLANKLNPACETFHVYVPITMMLHDDIMDIFEKSIHYRYYSKLETQWYSLSKPEDFTAYMSILLSEYCTISEHGKITHREILLDNHSFFYETSYNFFKSLKLGDNKAYHLDKFHYYVNPLYTFNVEYCRMLLDCSNRPNSYPNTKGFVFIPLFSTMRHLIHMDLS